MLPDNGCKIRFWWLLMQLPYTFGECDLVNTKCENACHYGLYCRTLFSRPVAEPNSFLAHARVPRSSFAWAWISSMLTRCRFIVFHNHTVTSNLAPRFQLRDDCRGRD